MSIESTNRSVMMLDDAHPAKKFLRAFIECKTNCVGRELALNGEAPIDQAWTSSDGRVWTFSGFAYAFLSLDIDLNSFLRVAPRLDEPDTIAAWNCPLRSLMDECAQAARQSGNKEILDLTQQVQQMLVLWEEFLSFRKEMISQARG